MIAKGPKYRFPVHIDFQKCREKIAASLNEYCNRWCKRDHVECDALKDWKLNIFKIIDRRISFYSQNTKMLPRKPKISYRYLKLGIEEFYRKFVLVPTRESTHSSCNGCCTAKRVSRNFIGSTSWFQQIKLQTTLLLFDGCTTLIF